MISKQSLYLENWSRHLTVFTKETHKTTTILTVREIKICFQLNQNLVSIGKKNYPCALKIQIRKLSTPWQYMATSQQNRKHLDIHKSTIKYAKHCSWDLPLSQDNIPTVSISVVNNRRRGLLAAKLARRSFSS